MNPEDIVAGLVALNGGELVGRTRLQKQTYLLDRCGANFGLRFTLSSLRTVFVRACRRLRRRGSGGASRDRRTGRSSWRALCDLHVDGRQGRRRMQLGELPAARARSLLGEMRGVSDIVLELAATIVFLRDEWSYYGKGKTDAVEETKARKSLKATEGRIGEALDLLGKLGLEEAEVHAAR